MRIVISGIPIDVQKKNIKNIIGLKINRKLLIYLHSIISQ